MGMVAAIGVVTALSACGESGFGEHGASSSYEISDALASLRVDEYAGDIEIKIGDGPVKVTETMEYRDTKPVSWYSVSNGELLLEADRCQADGVCNVDYEITVPASLAVALTSGGGAVDVSGVTGDVVVDSGGGAVDVAGAVEVDSGGGKVAAVKLSSPKLGVDSGGGGVKVAMSVAPQSVSVRTGGGGADMALPGGPFQVNADAGGGPKKVEVETAASGPSVNVDTGGGRLVVKAA